MVVVARARVETRAMGARGGEGKGGCGGGEG
jgi:hypothetical protein